MSIWATDRQAGRLSSFGGAIPRPPVNCSSTEDRYDRWLQHWYEWTHLWFLGSKNRWDKVRQKVGLVDFKFHDLRKTFGSVLAQNGVSTLVIQRLLEHSSPDLTNKVYTNVDPVLRQAIDSMSASDWLRVRIVGKKRYRVKWLREEKNNPISKDSNGSTGKEKSKIVSHKSVLRS